MATGNAWLLKQRKPDLADIADHIGVKNHNRYKKSDLEMVIEQHLRENQTSLQRDPKVAPFFQGVDPASPVKHNPGPAEEKTKTGARSRRQTLKAREELDAASEDSSTPSTALTKATATTTRTPSRALALARQVPLPPSPAVLANQIDAHTSNFRNKISTTLSQSPLPTTLQKIRSSLSSSTSLQLLILTLEALGLFPRVLPLRYLGTTPAVPALGLGEIGIKAPDLFALLTYAFWGPVGLWIITSIVLPVAGAWFVNLRGEEVGGYDAVSFNVVKGLVAWIVFVNQGVGGESREVLESSVPGGGVGMCVGAGVGGLAGLYEAVLRK